MSRFMRLFVCVFALVFIGMNGSFAASCTSSKTYTSCKAGYYMTSSSSSTTCNTSQTAGNACRPCSAYGSNYSCAGGTACPVETKVRCTAGTYLPANSSTCTTCPSGGYYCPGGLFTKNYSSIQGRNSCPSISTAKMTTYPDKWYPYTNTSTVDKSGGVTVSSVEFRGWGNTGWSAITSCTVSYSGSNSAGYFYAETAGYNSSTGKYDNNAEIYYTKLNSKYYLDTRWSDTYCDNSANRKLYRRAIACPAGYYCAGFTSYPMCSESAYATEWGRTICPAGNYCPAKSSSATPCGYGKYRQYTGGTSSSSCSSCTTNNTATTTTNTATAKSSCICNAGYGGDASTSSTCTACSAGYYKLTSGNYSCNACPEGAYNTGTGNESCTACLAGTSTNGTGKTSCSSDNCANNYNNSVSTWITPILNRPALEDLLLNNNPKITVTNVCAVNTCKANYTKRTYSHTTNPIYSGECIGNLYKITLNRNGGTGGVDYVYQKYGECFEPSTQDMCMNGINGAIPTKSGATFMGFYTSSTPGAGTQITNSNNLFTVGATYFTSNTTIYARWQETPTVSRTTWEPITVNGVVTGYYAYAYVTVPSGDAISSVSFPTWTLYNGQDDLPSNWETGSSATATAGSWTVNGSTYNYRFQVLFSAHNNEKPTSSSTSSTVSGGQYYTDVYVRTKNGYFGYRASIRGIYFIAMTLNTNGGTGALTNNMTGIKTSGTTNCTYYCPYNKPCSLPSASAFPYRKAGYYTSNGAWNTAADGSGTTYSPTPSLYTFSAARTLYIKWTECGTGYYCTTSGRYPCTSYRANTTTTTTTASSSSSCVCRANYYLNGTTCSACSSLGGGVYGYSLVGSTSNTACYTNVSAGYYLPSSESKAHEPCPEGKYCSAAKLYYPNVYTLGTNYFNCPNWTYRPETGGKTVSDCTACPTLTSGWAAWESGTGWAEPTNCTQYMIPENCTNGFVAQMPDEDNPSVWGPKAWMLMPLANAGHYVDQENFACPACPVGSYSEESNHAPECTPASPGYYVPTTGATSQIACAVGSFSAEGAYECTACGDGGNWGKTTTGTGQASCNKDCGIAGAKGYINAEWNPDNTVTGLCVPNACVENYYLDATRDASNNITASSCKLCSSFANGLYPHSSKSGTSKGQEACFVRRNELPGQYIATAGDDVATDCPAGSYNGTTDETAVHYGETFKCKTCAADTYAAGTGNAECKPCLENYHTFGEKTSEDACRILCPGGSYLPVARATECSAVGVGYWAPSAYVTQGKTSGRNACASGLTTVGHGAGADEADDCGKVLHIGNDKLYLRSAKKTTPSLNLSVGGKTYYGNMSTEDKKVSNGATQPLKLKYNNVSYSVFDDSGEFYNGGGTVSLSPSLTATATVPANYAAANGETQWSATLSDGTVVAGAAGCSATTSSNGTIGAAGFTPESAGTGCWCKITSPAAGAKWVYGTTNSACTTKCAFFCANNMKGTDTTFRTALYNTAGILKE